jgi:fatty-acyl-CoA synthase
MEVEQRRSSSSYSLDPVLSLFSRNSPTDNGRNPQVDPLHLQTIGDTLRRTARRSPERLALRFEDRTWTYRQLDDQVNCVANGLSEVAGIATGDRVAILSRNSAYFVLLRFALARLGSVLVPINFMLGPEEVAHVLRHSGARVLCAAPDLVETAAAAVGLRTSVDRCVLMSDSPGEGPAAGWIPFPALISERPDEPQVDLGTDDIAQIVYTSGTESLPKGAMLTHAALLWPYTPVLVDAQVARDDVILHGLPLYHCAQLDVFLGPGVYVGASNVLIDQPRPDIVLPSIQEHRITSFFAPPTVWIGLLRSPLFDQTDLSSLRKAYYGASIMPLEVAKELSVRLPHVRFWNLYGQTEIAPLATCLYTEDSVRKRGSVGKPTLNVETRVVDLDMRDVVPGEVGEIVHRSPQLLQGYYRDDDKTAEVFDSGWFHSGDLATVDDDGYITVVDRKKDMIKSGGENVASREVEEVIYQLTGVAEVAVVGLPHPRWIEAVTAIVVPKVGNELTEELVIAHCRRHLASFKVPKGAVIVASLPKNPSGKILKRSLRDAHARLYALAQVTSA